jgi:hypothetical protein
MQVTVLLDELLQQSENVNFSDLCLRDIDSIFHFTKSNNAEIKSRWQKLCLAADCDWYVPTLT